MKVVLYHKEFGIKFGGDDIKSNLGSADWYKLNKEQEKFYLIRGVFQNVLNVQKLRLVGIVEQYIVALNPSETGKL